MAKRKERIKVYERYCSGAIWTGFLALLLVGIFIAALFLPLFVYAGNGAEPVFINGIDFIIYSFRGSIFSKVYPSDPKLLDFDNMVTAYSMPNEMYKFIGQYHAIIEMVLCGFFFIAIIFALVVAVFGFIMLAAGRVHSPILPSALSSSSVFFLTLFFSLGFLYFFLCHNMLVEIGSSQWVMIHYVPIILLSAAVVILVSMNIIYHISFKGKRFVGSVTNVSEDDFQPERIFDENNQDPTNLPYGINYIGDEAFAMNTALKTAYIPDGINALGAGAFSNCLNLEVVSIPLSVMNIGKNCFFNTPSLRQIIYQGSMEEWANVYKGENWLTMSGVTVIDTNNGRIPADGYYYQN